MSQPTSAQRQESQSPRVCDGGEFDVVGHHHPDLTLNADAETPAASCDAHVDVDGGRGEVDERIALTGDAANHLLNEMGLRTFTPQQRARMRREMLTQFAPADDGPQLTAKRPIRVQHTDMDH